MLDSLVRKFTKLNKPQSNHSSFCSSSSSSSFSSSSSSNLDTNRNFIMLELYDLNEEENSKVKLNTTTPIRAITELPIEHIYEEIEESKIIMYREELVNEILPLSSSSSTTSSLSSSASSSFSSKKKKSVRFNSTFNKNNEQTVSNSITNELVLCAECVDCLKQQQQNFNSILKKPSPITTQDESNASSSSSSSSSSFYTTNSLNSTSSSTHSHTFNNLVEEFLNHVTSKKSSPSKSNTLLSNSNLINTLPLAFKHREASVTLGLGQSCTNKKGTSSSCKSFVYFKNNNSENNVVQNNKNAKSLFELNKIFNIASSSSPPPAPSLTKQQPLDCLNVVPNSMSPCCCVDDRLSFRVTNLTMQDLKNRQKLIELKKSSSAFFNY
jgi:trimeric autotransporter adhesin